MGDASTPDPTRTSPVRREVLVMVAFAVFVGIGVATVLVPALTDDAHDEARGAGTQGAATTAGASTNAAAASGAAAAPATPPDALRLAPQPAPPTQPVGP